MKLASVLLLICGIVLAVVGITALADHGEDAPTVVAIKDFEDGKAPAGKRWLKVTGGELCWNAPWYPLPRAKRDEKEQTIQGYYVPLASKETAAVAQAVQPNDAKPSFANVRLLVFVTEAEMKAANPKWTEDDAKAVTQYDAQGLVTALADAKADLKNKVVGDTTGLDVTKVSILNVGDQPLRGNSGVLTLAAAGALVLAGIGLWVVGSRRQRVLVVQPAAVPAGGAEIPFASVSGRAVAPSRTAPLPPAARPPE